MNTRSSIMLSPLVKQVRYLCSNENCGHQSVSFEQMDHSTVPPNFPNPKVNLPVIKPRDARPPARGQDDQYELAL